MYVVFVADHDLTERKTDYKQSLKWTKRKMAPIGPKKSWIWGFPVSTIFFVDCHNP